MKTKMVSSSSTSSASRSLGQRHREERAMEHHAPPSPASPTHLKGRKHRRHRHHSPPPPHRCHHLHNEPGMLRVKPPKSSKKVRKLHHKLMKAYKLPKSARHRHHHLTLFPHGHHHLHSPHGHHRHFPPAEEGHFSTHHPPGCCLHRTEVERSLCEEQRRLHEMGLIHHHCRSCRDCAQAHRSLSHMPCRMCPSTELRGGMGGRVTEATAERPIEGGAAALPVVAPPADETAPAALLVP